MKLTKDQIKHLEVIHNVWIDRESQQYNHNGYDAIYNWKIIPDEWIDEMKQENSGGK